jgi:hypothetical protein
MELPRKIQAGSAARDAEDEAKARRSEGMSIYGSGSRGAGQPLSLSPRGSSRPTPQAVSREEYVRNAEIKVSGGGGQKFEALQRTGPGEALPVTAADPAPATAPPAAPGVVGAVFAKFRKLFGFK